MKFLVKALALAGIANAFPSQMWQAIAENPELAERASEIMKEFKDQPQKRQVGGVLPSFHAKQQLISVSGANKFVPPGPTDLRGPCPGLNAFANHGYLPHNGYATITDFIDATMNVVGMGPLLAQFLAVYGAVMDGDLTAWSIGGPPPDSFLSIPPVLGKGQGISSSHNKYESDVSPTRPDLYEYGNDYKLRIQQFQDLFDQQPDAATANYDIAVLGNFRYKRFQQSIKKNPYFFNGPFTGVLVQPAAFTFIYRFMANHSKENPEGLLNQDVLKSWFAVKGQSGHFKWTPGYERIPENWYRRALDDDYDTPYFFQDVAAHAATYPIFLSVGGNTGKVNTFTPVDVANLTGGVYNSQTIGENNAFACLAFEFAANAQPDVAANSIATLLTAIGQITTALGCPDLSNIDDSQFGNYPGYNLSLPTS